MKDPRNDKLAELLVDYSTGIHQGDRVVIEAASCASPLVEAIYIEVLQAGGFPLVMQHSMETNELLLRYGSREQIEYVPEISRLIAEQYEARIFILGDDNTRTLSSIDPAKKVWYSQARTDLMKTSMRRSAEGTYRWVVAPYPTNAQAQDADMSLREYEDFVFGACMPDLNNPVGYWQKVSTEQQRIIDWLQGKQHIHVTGPETDLHLSVSGRKFINCDGKNNVPDGEIFTGPVENSAEGQVYFSYPAIESGLEVSGIRLCLKKGRLSRPRLKKRGLFEAYPGYGCRLKISGGVRYRDQ